MRAELSGLPSRNELYQEQKERFGNPDGTFRDLTYEDLKELKVLDYVIRETLRLHAPIHSIMRKVRLVWSICRRLRLMQALHLGHLRHLGSQQPVIPETVRERLIRHSQGPLCAR
jgi:hypothetical protein